MSLARGTTLGVLQARVSSTRLPGKVLLPLAGRPMILRQLERLARARTLDAVVIATSEDTSDDPLAEVLMDAGYPVVRGPLDDVYSRFLRVMDQFDPDVVVRLTGDCPLTSPSVVDLVVSAFHASDADYVSNTLEPTFPDGLDVEVLTTEALREVGNEELDVHEREHVTLGIYRRPETFRIMNVTDPSGANHAHLRWTVDDQADFDFVSTVYDTLLPRNPHFDYADILNFSDTHPDLTRTEVHARRNSALDGLDTGAMHHASGS